MAVQFVGEVRDAVAGDDDCTDVNAASGDGDDGHNGDDDDDDGDEDEEADGDCGGDDSGSDDGTKFCNLTILRVMVMNMMMS